jgi:hypothetical protein
MGKRMTGSLISILPYGCLINPAKAIFAARRPVKTYDWIIEKSSITPPIKD